MTAARTASRAAASVVTAVLGLGALTGCAYVDSNPGLEEVAAPGAQNGVTVERLLEATEYVEGRTVTVDAVVTGTIGERAMTVVGRTSAAGPLLVVLQPHHDPVEGSGVRVTGVVRQSFDRRTAADEFDIDPGDEALAVFDAEPYLIALDVDDLAVMGDRGSAGAGVVPLR